MNKKNLYNGFIHNFFPFNRPEHVATAIVELIEKGGNGTVFVSENNQPTYAVQLPIYTDLKISV